MKLEREIRENIEKLFENYPELNNGGIKSDQNIFRRLKGKKNQIPNWYIELLIEFPIAELKIGIPFNYGWESLKDKKQKSGQFTLLNLVTNIIL